MKVSSYPDTDLKNNTEVEYKYWTILEKQYFSGRKNVNARIVSCKVY